MSGPQQVAGGFVIEAPTPPDVSGLSADEAARVWWEWEAEFDEWIPDALDLLPWDLWADVGLAGWRESTDGPACPPDSATVQGELAASLTAAGYPEHVVAHLVALAPVLAGGTAATCPAATALPSAPGAGASDDSEGAARADSVGGAEATRGDSPSKGDRPSDGELVAAAEAVVVVQRWTDALLAGVLADLAAATGEVFLAEKGVTDPEELSRTARERWRAKTKSVLANELKVLTGWGIQDCHDRIGFALGPRQATAIPWRALATGEVQWNQVRAWWSTCRGMPVEVAAQMAARAFGPDSDRAKSARRSQGSNNRGDAARSSFGETKDDLARLVAALLGEDPDAAREERQAALARRDATARLDDDGTGELTVMGRSSAVVAAIDRIDQIARAVRAAGDPRTLAQLRSDIAMSLLIHGSVTPATGHPDPGPGAAPGKGTRAAGEAGCVAGEGPPAASEGACDETRDSREGAKAASPTQPPDPPGSVIDTSAADSGGGVVGAPDEALARVLAGWPTANLEVVVPLEVLLSDESVGVGMLPGRGYLSAEEVRELALQAGGMLHRLVTDEMDGRVIERSRAAYAPDQEMRVQVAAADRICRAPGCLVPAAKCQFDHVENYGDGESGGPTSETNGQSLHGVHHQLKTWGAWKAVMDDYRNVTWTTLFGRIYPTRAFDYRALTHPWTPGSTGTEKHDSGWRAALAGDRHLQDDVVYAALAHRDRDTATLAGHDDRPDPEFLDLGRGWLHHRAPIQLRHLTRTGRRRNGPPPGQPTPEDLLADRTESSGPPDAVTDPAAEPPPF